MNNSYSPIPSVKSRWRGGGGGEGARCTCCDRRRGLNNLLNYVLGLHSGIDIPLLYVYFHFHKHAS